MNKTISFVLVSGLTFGSAVFTLGGSASAQDGSKSDAVQSAAKAGTEGASKLGFGPGAHRDGQHGPSFEKLDTNSDGKITKDEFVSDVKSHFLEADANKDGKVTKDELKQAADKKREEFKARLDDKLKESDKNGDGKWSKDELPPPVAHRFDKLDTNHDGFLSQDELKAAKLGGDVKHPDGDAKRTERLEKHFAKLDTNHDGALDSSELDKLAQAKFDKLDKNKDGVLTQDELKAAHEHGGKFGAHGGPGRGKGHDHDQDEDDSDDEL